MDCRSKRKEEGDQQKIRMVVGMRGGGALSGGKAMDKDCGPREEGV